MSKYKIMITDTLNPDIEVEKELFAAIGAEAFSKAGVERLDSLDELFAQADILSIHAPLNDGTRGIINDTALAKMKPTAYLINTARGGLMDLDAVYHALKSGVIAGAGLDVMPVEPPPAVHPIFTLENLVVTPHCSYYSDDAEDDLRRKSIREAILALTEGQPEHYLNRPKQEG